MSGCENGTRHWVCELQSTCFGSPLIVNDTIYVADEDGDVCLLRLSSDPQVALQKDFGMWGPLKKIDTGQSIYASPIFANGVLYVANTHRTLFAIPSAGLKAAAIQHSETGPIRSAGRGFWPQWRGPNRDNLSTATHLLQEWPAEGPPLVYRVDGLGGGIASLSINDGRILTVDNHESKEHATAIDERTGEWLWSTPIGGFIPQIPTMRLLSQRSPTIDGPQSYVIASDGHLVCLRNSDGRIAWNKDYSGDSNAKRPTWGFCDYPLVDGDKLICAPGAPEASVVALNKDSGAVIWTCAVPNGGQASYAATVVTEAGGVRQYLVFLGKALVGIRASDGKLLWRYARHVNNYANSQTPFVLGDRILTPNGYSTGVALLRLTATDGAIDAHEEYYQKINLDPFQQSTVLQGDYFYTINASGLLSCLEWRTGRTVWDRIRTGGIGKVAMTFADGHFYFLHSDGRLTLAKADGDGYVEKGSFGIPDHQPAQGATFPVITNGRLYVRDESRLFCYDIRENALTAPRSGPRLVRLPELKLSDDGGTERDRPPRSIFSPTPQDVVEKMLDLADVHRADVVYDLGSGDGRIVIAAARKYGCKAVGYEIDQDLVTSSPIGQAGPRRAIGDDRTPRPVRRRPPRCERCGTLFTPPAIGEAVAPIRKASSRRTSRIPPI